MFQKSWKYSNIHTPIWLYLKILIVWGTLISDIKWFGPNLHKLDTKNESISLVPSNLVKFEKLPKIIKKVSKNTIFWFVVFLSFFNSNSIWVHWIENFIFSFIFVIFRSPRDLWICLNSGDIIYERYWTLKVRCV